MCLETTFEPNHSSENSAAVQPLRSESISTTVRKHCINAMATDDNVTFLVAHDEKLGDCHPFNERYNGAAGCAAGTEQAAQLSSAQRSGQAGRRASAGMCPLAAPLRSSPLAVRALCSAL